MIIEYFVYRNEFENTSDGGHSGAWTGPSEKKKGTDYKIVPNTYVAVQDCLDRGWIIEKQEMELMSIGLWKVVVHFNDNEKNDKKKLDKKAR